MVEEAARRVFTIARAVEARSVEINPLAITRDGRLVAADCRITIDDYAVARHPELGIDFARELDHPPTALEKIAYTVEQADHRGTFFFAQMNTHAQDEPSNRGARSPGLIGFHGAGGGGSMMSMDAITHEGFTLANFCDTSGNPSPAKVYRAARIILQQPGLVGYFGSGSGVANQEQFWSAYGLAKAFWEMNLDIPAVIRLGGNTEDRAVEILQSAAKGLPAPVEGYRKTDPPAKVAARLAELVRSARGGSAWQPRPPRRPAFVGAPGSARFELKGGRLWIDAAAWATSAPAIIARSNGLLKNDAGRPALTVKPEEFLTRDSDMIACEVECRRDGVEGVFVELDISGLTA
jgi:succinyl-CoA synthetase beta subunit